MRMRRQFLSLGSSIAPFSSRALLALLCLPLLLVGDIGCSSSDSNPSPGSPGALDGVWDITSNVRGGPAQMTISGGVLTGFMADRREGGPYEGLANCTATKYRTEFSGTVSGNGVTGSRTNITELSGSGCGSSPPAKAVTKTFTGVRALTAPNWDGEWKVSGEGEEWTAKVNGVNATATSKPNSKRRGEDSVQIVLAGDDLTISSSDDALTLVARRRR
ncbi:hypothetical protein [Pendulispora albinea]|uniref:Lipocalin-like domain-containing protein n=1 Tax=Pendulispora albinea TaxID=2741071 RepID=A0ABZ2LYA1_9BACT